MLLWWSQVPGNFHSDRGLFEYWEDDIEELRFLLRNLKPGSVFLDIGAHHGVYSVVAARHTRNRAHIVAFEPSPRDRRRLKLHLRLNGASSVRVEAYAVASANGTARLFLGRPTMSSLRYLPSAKPAKTVTVETITLDEYVKRSGLDRIDLMKVDTEGGELEVFRGAGRVLESFRPVIICEILDELTAPWGYPAREIVARLHGYDYDWYDFCCDGRLLPHTPRQEYPMCRNYVAVPRENHSSITRRVCRLGEGVPA